MPGADTVSAASTAMLVRRVRCIGFLQNFTLRSAAETARAEASRARPASPGRMRRRVPTTPYGAASSAIALWTRRLGIERKGFLAAEPFRRAVLQELGPACL